MGLADTGFSENAYAKWALSWVVVLVIAFGAIALYFVKKYRWNDEDTNNEFYFTARGSKGKWLIAWSFYASAVGSWVIAAVPDYAFWGGILGLFFYAVAAGLPLIILALFGNKIQEQYPRVLSMSDYCTARFGPLTLGLAVVLTLFNMAIASCAEYTTVASLMSDFLGMGDYDIFVILLIGIVTLTYTTLGGLSVSILTDRVQGVFTMIIFVIIVIYLASTFHVPGGLYQRAKLDDDLDRQLKEGVGNMGHSAFFTMPLSLITATVFSEAMWQRVWAGENRKSVVFGASIAAVMVFVVVFTIGFTGIIGGWAYSYPMYDVNPNVRMFYVLSSFNETASGDIVTNFDGTINSVIAVIVVIFAVTMTESAIDSMQNGIAASLNGAVANRLTARQAKIAGRVGVVLLNIPMVIVGLLKTQVIKLFLMANMVCTSAAFPIVLGIIRHPILDKYHTDLVAPVTFTLSLFCMTFYALSVEGISSYRDAVSLVFWDNQYEWQYFAVGFGCSVGFTGLFIAMNYMFGWERSKQTPWSNEIPEPGAKRPNSPVKNSKVEPAAEETEMEEVHETYNTNV